MVIEVRDEVRRYVHRGDGGVVDEVVVESWPSPNPRLAHGRLCRASTPFRVHGKRFYCEKVKSLEKPRHQVNSEVRKARHPRRRPNAIVALPDPLPIRKVAVYRCLRRSPVRWSPAADGWRDKGGLWICFGGRMVVEGVVVRATGEVEVKRRLTAIDSPRFHHGFDPHYNSDSLVHLCGKQTSGSFALPPLRSLDHHLLGSRYLRDGGVDSANSLP